MVREEIRIINTIKKNKKNQSCILGIITIIFVLAYILKNKNMPILLRFINGSFIIGIIYILLGMRIYIRNVGLFKTFRYFAYKLKSGAYSNKKMGQVHTMSLAEFTEEIMNDKNRRSSKFYYLYGIPLVVLSYVLAFLS